MIALYYHKTIKWMFK